MFLTTDIDEHLISSFFNFFFLIDVPKFYVYSAEK